MSKQSAVNLPGANDFTRKHQSAASDYLHNGSNLSRTLSFGCFVGFVYLRELGDSALGELPQVDFESISMVQLYGVSDLLDGARKAIENHLFNQLTDLFGLNVTVTLYDLTNTYFEGVAAAQPLAQHGHSKEKRSDCPLLTLGLVVDGSGFVRRSEVMAGNIVKEKSCRAH